MTFTNNLDPDEAPQIWGFIWDPNCLTFRLYIAAKQWVETMNFLKILKETNIWKSYPACKELKSALALNRNVNILAPCSYTHLLFFLFASFLSKTRVAPVTHRPTPIAFRLSSRKSLQHCMVSYVHELISCNKKKQAWAFPKMLNVHL